MLCQLSPVTAPSILLKSGTCPPCRSQAVIHCVIGLWPTAWPLRRWETCIGRPALGDLHWETQLMSQMTSATCYDSDPALCCCEDGTAACDVYITSCLLCHCQRGICQGSQWTRLDTHSQVDLCLMLSSHHSLTHSLSHSVTHPPTHPPTHPLTHSLTHSSRSH